MIGIIDIGGGLRGIYTSGIYDYLLDNNITIDYCIGVSSGSANLISYVAGQRGRSKKFYQEYSFEKEAMGIGTYFKHGMLINLDYLYSEISNSTGKDPADYEAVKNSTINFNTVATDALTCKPIYFTKDDFSKDDYTLIKACCAMPVACRKPINFKGTKLFDGGLSDPIPYKKAFADGCDKLIICTTLPKDFVKEPMPEWIVNILLRKYPKIRDSVLTMHNSYNNGIKEIFELEKQGKALVIYPEECFGIDTLTREKEGMEKLYQLGYNDGKKIEEYLKANKQLV